MDIHEIIFVPLILFMIFVAPIWVIMHYRSKNKIGQGLSDQELSQLNELAQRAEKMADRIKTLEAILDAESPKWRAQHD
ncbi:MAG: envelope stress response membrane protein PspB [Alteromonadaceae bacterium]|jgi:phage shock protein B|uniref:Envelope stress response membrane protein PspB n=1 Tax=Rheinheimera aquimaris TaxID=412437 RepID=A0ABN1DWY8_9GAMM|nr:MULTISPECIES: envelope stress response membrane protein PspB [Rheinheimera]MBJ91215.1 envelope stress response membrane protein PspB [Alteromonadaceae bacterium]MCB5213816.1 envelope stress response membrane protein PspB [Rheinheimera aquimaris]MCD1598002.1 envelope stress response membrane protein PspB [Rheinheimera aquimaris]HBN87813.1 envelope stress response membrane protein PspB [Rheinheimera sp.]|tara:strand:+ start:830 stop:1066 length:237 start_codon:yes stop_codon:yes gene_type:complete